MLRFAIDVAVQIDQLRIEAPTPTGALIDAMAVEFDAPLRR
jgi:hypothetical protein